MKRITPFETVVLPAHTTGLFQTAIRRAAEVLKAGGLVALPTETVYGLAANALDAGAVRGIFEAKGRPSHNPIIVHVADYAMARKCARAWPDVAQALAERFWPGPLTLVLPRSEIVPDIVTAGGQTVGLRWPAHPIMQGVIRECGFPLAAPSANASNQLSPTNTAHVVKQLGGRIPLVIDGGQCNVGIESTVLDLSGPQPVILRPGMILESALQPITGPLAKAQGESPTEVLKSPGRLEKHYAPRARLLLLEWRHQKDLVKACESLGFAPQQTAVLTHNARHLLADTFKRVAVVPADPEAFSRALYAELHACDETGADLIIVEAPPNGEEWQAIRDRLTRASGKKLE